MARITVAALSAQMSDLTSLVSQFIGATAVHTTPAPILTLVAPLAAPVAAPVAAPAPAVVAAGDALKDFVESKGLAFARGGRVLLTTAMLQAAVRVLKSGTPEIIPVEGVGSLDKRSITHLAIGRSNDGKSVLTQYVFTSAAE